MNTVLPYYRKEISNFSISWSLCYCLCAALSLIGFVSSSSYFTDNNSIQQAQAQPQQPLPQMQQWPQHSFETSTRQYFSLQYPPGWKVNDTGSGVQLSGHNIGMIIEADVPVPNNVVYTSADMPMNNIAQKEIQSMSQYYKYIGSQMLGSQYNPIVKIVYQHPGDNTYLVEYLAKRSSGILASYKIVGTPDQIAKYEPLTTRVIQSVKFNPSWEAEVRGLLSSIQQSILNTYGIAVESYKGMATQFHNDAQALKDYQDRKNCQNRGFPGTNICP